MEADGWFRLRVLRGGYRLYGAEQPAFKTAAIANLESYGTDRGTDEEQRLERQ